MITALYERLSRDDEQLGESKLFLKAMPSSMASRIASTIQTTVIVAATLSVRGGSSLLRILRLGRLLLYCQRI